MAFDHDEDREVNPSRNTLFADLVTMRLSRRDTLAGGRAAPVTQALGFAGRAPGQALRGGPAGVG